MEDYIICFVAFANYMNWLLTFFFLQKLYKMFVGFSESIK